MTFLDSVYTAISRKVVGKSARDNPERHCGWFWVLFFSKKFERIGTKGHGNVSARAKGKQQKYFWQLQSSRTVYWSCPILLFGLVAGTVFPTTFLEIAVKKKRFYVAVGLFSNRSRKTSKCYKNISDTVVCSSCATYFVFTTFFCPLWSITEHDAQQHGIYLLTRPWEIVVYLFFTVQLTVF